MKKTLSIVIIALMSLSSCTLAARQVSKETRNVEDAYTALQVYNNVEVDYTIGAAGPVKVEYRDGATASDFIMEVINGALVMRQEGHGKVKVTMSGPAVKDLLVENNAEIDIEQMLGVNDDVKISASNNGEVKLGGVSCANLHVAAANNAEVKIGRVLTSEQVEVAAANNADVKFGHTDCVRISIASANNADVAVSALKCTSSEFASANNADIVVKGSSPASAFAVANNATIEATELLVNHATAAVADMSTLHCHVAQLTVTDRGPRATIRNVK